MAKFLTVFLQIRLNSSGGDLKKRRHRRLEPDRFALKWNPTHPCLLLDLCERIRVIENVLPIHGKTRQVSAHGIFLQLTVEGTVQK